VSFNDSQPENPAPSISGVMEISAGGESGIN